MKERNFFYDLEFIEGKQTKFGIVKTKETIDLISIGMVSSEGYEYYAICSDFNLYEAWNRYDEKIEIMSGDARNKFPEGRKYKEYWIRENVLKKVWQDLYKKYLKDEYGYLRRNYSTFSYTSLKYLLEMYGKPKKQIAKELIKFVYGFDPVNYSKDEISQLLPSEVKFHGYYSAYDHVCLCWIFGVMNDLPELFPKYTIDVKQMFDREVRNIISKYSVLKDNKFGIMIYDFKIASNKIKESSYYPKQNENTLHSAIEDARWIKLLYEFVITMEKPFKQLNSEYVNAVDQIVKMTKDHLLDAKRCSNYIAGYLTPSEISKITALTGKEVIHMNDGGVNYYKL